MKKQPRKEKLVEGGWAAWGHWGSYHLTIIFGRDVGPLEVMRDRSLAGKGFVGEKALWCLGLDPLNGASLLSLWDVCFCIIFKIGANYGVPTSGVSRINCQSLVSGVLNNF